MGAGTQETVKAGPGPITILRLAVTTGSAAATVSAPMARMAAIRDGDPERFLSFLLLLSSLMICLLYRYDLLVYSPDSVLI